MRSIFKSVASVFFLLLLLFTGGLTSAQNATPESSPMMEEEESRAIAFYPEETGQGTFITVELEAGESTEADVLLGNVGNIEQTLRTYPVPALSGINGGFVLADYGTENDAITDWLNYDEQQFTLQPTEGVVLQVGISVPDGTAPGEYVTGLAAEQAESFEIPGTEMMRQRVRWSVPILIVVPGEREPAFEVGEAQLQWYEGSMYGTIEIANTGNVTVRPQGEVRLLDAEGTVVGVAEVELGSIYNGTETTFVVAWQTPPPSETYSISLALTAEEGTVSVTQEHSDLVPLEEGETAQADARDPLVFSKAELTPLTKDNPPSTLQFDAEISNNGEVIENARVSIVTYKDGEEVDRYPIMQAVTIQPGTTPIEARYSLPGGFTDGTYTFEVTIELGDSGSQTVLVTQPIEYEITVGD